VKPFVLMASSVVAGVLTGTSNRLGPPSHSPAIMRTSSQPRHPAKKLRPSFEANVGQFNDDVQFTLRSRDYTTYLTRLDAALALRRSVCTTRPHHRSAA
jgi:hypothetical protein